ncbi:hypothetical protein Lfu02_79580 [Longispora fulva]|uniref:Lipoprotein n=1 Tax=Longispora fulva TaxID=619741 RepID=A0A8J7GCL5_9ACTN|nr:hypothetical protein [Longispora fulva]MBG6133987.1 hypothetical protein [Longispora fulva]GIG63586.1 hypothetical protein Lfu02_79580 [Longispora fulva]
MRLPGPARLSATAAIALVLLAGCDGTGNEVLPTGNQAEASQQVQSYFRGLAAIVAGQGRGRQVGLGPAPCEGRKGETAADDRYYIQGTYDLPFAADRDQQAVFQLLETSWKAEGYEFTEPLDRLPSGDWTLTVRNPTDGYKISVTGYDHILRALIFSPCYLPPA